MSFCIALLREEERKKKEENNDNDNDVDNDDGNNARYHEATSERISAELSRRTRRLF